MDKVTSVRLDNMLQLIVRLSSAKHDPCLEDLHSDPVTMDLAKQMSKIHEAGSYDDAISHRNGLDGIFRLQVRCSMAYFNRIESMRFVAVSNAHSLVVLLQTYGETIMQSVD